ncbi:MAG: threonine--tRNA ligase [Anaerolineae bacterium]|nr:threonine--tRNA ligase [Anaerolineae bacterium]
MGKAKEKQEEVPYAESHLYKIRHSAAHVMAQAVIEMFPNGKVAIGPPIEDGFYYDFELPRALTPDDLDKIEKRMRKIIKGKYAFERQELSADKAREVFADQPYKIELIEGLESGGYDEYGEKIEEAPVISIYKHDTFEDLCRGPHVENTGEINPSAVKLLNVAGAYWRGDEKNTMLQRIYGTAWESVEELEAYLERLKEAQERDHRTLGRELDLFSFSQDVGPGLALWHPNGGRIRAQIEEYWSQRHREGGYERVYTPHIGKANLWQTSGHLNWYKDGMYAPLTIEEQEYYIKPMNCPFHIAIFKSQMHSYRDLPMRFAEFGTVYRYERSGTLHGLMRVRGFTQDDAHLFCTLEQMPEEILGVLEFSLSILRDFGFQEFDIELSVRDPKNPGKYAGQDSDWKMAEAALISAIEKLGLSYRRVEGEAVFYGPKIDIKVHDALNRTWQITTIQFDFWLPEAFEMEFVGQDGEPHQPYMVHRALLGSMERFFGVLIEHYKGAFPVWLAPVQAELIPIADRHFDYAYDALAKLKAAGLRAEVDDSGDRMGNKIRKAQGQKVPYMLVIGDREIEEGAVSLRLRSGEDLGATSVDDFIAMAQEAVKSKAQV